MLETNTNKAPLVQLHRL